MHASHEVFQKSHLRLCPPSRAGLTSVLGDSDRFAVGTHQVNLTFGDGRLQSSSPALVLGSDVAVTDGNMHLFAENVMGNQSQTKKGPAYAPGLVPEGAADPTGRFLSESGHWGYPSEYTGVSTTSFLTLEDTPNTFVDQWGKFPRVSAEGKLEFVKMEDVHFERLEATEFVVKSDARTKQDIQDVDMNEVTDVLRGLNPVTFRYKDSPSKEHIGVLAQELQRLFPNSVVEGGDYLRVSYMELVGLLVATSKSLVHRVDALEEKVEKLMALVSA